ncbi:hypothetical protein PR048_031547 [Dryococelus australis]|uniref:Uncharacterized protein n=1 Tax=Dryococelus australis TaxID=614101 RepID=A0ABQ9G5L4_9NEOP|nr:hypothetical protein PR048_031547 [Dryococelus australis]
MQGWVKREIPEKPAASSATIPTCGNPGVTWLGIEPGSPWWEASSLKVVPCQRHRYAGAIFQALPARVLSHSDHLSKKTLDTGLEVTPCYSFLFMTLVSFPEARFIEKDARQIPPIQTLGPQPSDHAGFNRNPLHRTKMQGAMVCGSIACVSECHVADAQVIENPQDGQGVADTVTSFHADKTRYLIGLDIGTKDFCTRITIGPQKLCLEFGHRVFEHPSHWRKISPLTGREEWFCAAANVITPRDIHTVVSGRHDHLLCSTLCKINIATGLITLFMRRLKMKLGANCRCPGVTAGLRTVVSHHDRHNALWRDRLTEVATSKEPMTLYLRLLSVGVGQQASSNASLLRLMDTGVVLTCPPTMPCLSLLRSVCDQALLDHGVTDLRSAAKLNSLSWLCTNLRMFHGRFPVRPRTPVSREQFGWALSSWWCMAGDSVASRVFSEYSHSSHALHSTAVTIPPRFTQTSLQTRMMKTSPHVRYLTVCHHPSHEQEFPLFVNVTCRTLPTSCPVKRQQCSVLILEESGVKSKALRYGTTALPTRLFARTRGGVVVRPLTSHFCETGSIHSGVSPRFSLVGIVPGYAARRRVFLGISRFPPPLHSGVAPYSPRFTLIDSQDLDVKSLPNIFTHSLSDLMHKYICQRWLLILDRDFEPPISAVRNELHLDLQSSSELEWCNSFPCRSYIRSRIEFRTTTVQPGISHGLNSCYELRKGRLDTSHEQTVCAFCGRMHVDRPRVAMHYGFITPCSGENFFHAGEFEVDAFTELNESLSYRWNVLFNGMQETVPRYAEGCALSPLSLVARIDFGKLIIKEPLLKREGGKRGGGPTKTVSPHDTTRRLQRKSSRRKNQEQNSIAPPISLLAVRRLHSRRHLTLRWLVVSYVFARPSLSVARSSKTSRAHKEGLDIRLYTPLYEPGSTL